MHKLIKNGIVAAGVMLLAIGGLTACGASSDGGGQDGKITLSFQIWDTMQKEGMQAVADAYTKEHPDVRIQVQVTSWDEYWTKLEAAAESNQLPDIFWMHTNELLKYADYGMLADLTDLYEEESPSYYSDHYSDISLDNTKGSNGRIYGIPKDKDVVCLVYNKEMFDAAGVTYPDESWTWENLTSASETIYKKTGKYGYMAYADDQLGYWNFVYQAGGYILNEDKTEAGFTQPATQKAMKFYTDIQKNDWCPRQTYFAETQPGTAFLSEQGSMYLEGSWNLLGMMENNPTMIGKWDIAVLPACPDPEYGDGRATISNGLCYATGAKGKKLEAAKDFLKFAGSEQGQRAQGESGAAIPAYIGLEDTWMKVFDRFDYKVEVQNCIEMFEYGVQSVNNAARPNWKSKVGDELLKIYTGKVSLEDGLNTMQKAVEEAAAP